MPNHVTNEVIFRNIDTAKQDELLAKMCRDGAVDFELLLPPPINSWPGSVGSDHEKAFGLTHLDWARKNWGTKWNAYGQKPIERTVDSMTLVFDTAWRPPYGWLVAIFNTFKIDFEYNWIDEGDDKSWHGFFCWARLDDLGGTAWKEKQAKEIEYRRLHKLKWGVEQFEDEEDDEPKTA